MDKDAAKGASIWAAAFLTAGALALWGFGHRLYATVLPGLGVDLGLTPAGTDMARSAVALGYFLMTLPGAVISRHFGYKIGILFGLGTFAVGTFLAYPAIQSHSVMLFIAAATVFGSGLAVIEVTAVPLVIFMGSRAGAIARTVFAEGLSPLGALAALALGQTMMARAATDSHFVANLVAVLSAVGVVAIALAFVMEMAKFPAVAGARTPADLPLPGFWAPLGLKRFRFALAGIFLGLFAEIVIAGFAPSYALAAMPSLAPAQAPLVLVAGYSALLAGRLTGPLLMLRIAPMRITVWFSALAALCAFASAVTQGPAAVGLVIGTCFFMSVVIPSLMADAYRDLGEMAKSAAALAQIIAFSGTGLFALIAVANGTWILNQIMLVPAVCFVFTTALADYLRRHPGNAL